MSKEMPAWFKDLTFTSFKDFLPDRHPTILARRWREKQPKSGGLETIRSFQMRANRLTLRREQSVEECP